MRVSLTCPTLDMSRWLARVREAEQLGFSQVQLGDHLEVGRPGPFSALAAAAAATERIGLGTLVVDVGHWDVVALAREAVTLDTLSKGRFELGLGAGSAVDRRVDGAPAGCGNAARLRRLAEYVTALQQLLAGDEVTISGEFVDVDAVRIVAAPAAVPLLVGGTGSAALRIAATCDTAGLTGFLAPADDGPREMRLTHFTASGLEARLQMLRSFVPPGAPMPAVQVLVQEVRITSDRRSVAASLADDYPMLSIDELLESPFLLFGTEEEVAAQLVDRSRRFGVTTWSVFGDHPDKAGDFRALGPVLRLLDGELA